MAIIKKYNKQNGTTYVYESISYWDKEKQQPRSKRKLIGKIDDATGEIVPTGPRGRKSKKDLPSGDQNNGSSAAEITASVVHPDPVEGDLLPYEDLRRQLLEKEAVVARLTSEVTQLTKEKQELLKQLDHLLQEYRR